MNINNILGRTCSIFVEDIKKLNLRMAEIISESRFLVLGGGGTIGQAVSKEIFSRDPHERPFLFNFATCMPQSFLL